MFFISSVEATTLSLCLYVVSKSREFFIRDDLTLCRSVKKAKIAASSAASRVEYTVGWFVKMSSRITFIVII